MSNNLLDNFLTVAACELEENATTEIRQLKETNLFSEENIKKQDVIPVINDDDRKSKHLDMVHTGDTDSSDDEDNKYYEEQKYNEPGKEIKHLLKVSTATSLNVYKQTDVTWKTKPNSQQLYSAQPWSPTVKNQDVYTDPIFGLRMINPAVSFKTLQERMIGREAIAFSRIKKFIVGNISDKNWVIAGVIVGKSSVKTSQKGSQYLIWSLSDLKDDIKTVSIFLFGSAYKQLWKTATGTVVGILNSNVLDKKAGTKDEATLSVDNAQKVMILGESKDLGRCKSIKKNGEQCTSVVNINRCEYCIFHIKQEYQKCSKRSELQSNFSGKGLTALRNKVLGKNEVFYAGKSYTAIPAKRSKKLQERNESLLQALTSGKATDNILKSRSTGRKAQVKSAAHVEVTQQQRLRDLMLLEKLGGNDTKSTFNGTHSEEPTLESSRKLVSNVIAKLKGNSPLLIPPTNDDNTEPKVAESQKILQTKTPPKNKITVHETPLLSQDQKGIVDLDLKITTKQMHKAKLNALKYIQKNGPIKKLDPNTIKKLNENGKRVIIDSEKLENPPKKPKIAENEFLSERFKKMMEATSKHSDLLDERDNEEQEKYFHKLETKEKMEEKMINTFKVPCKAVQCLQCKYTNFSASQFCKDNKHPLKVFDTVKRFFKCGNCGNRTQSLEIIPSSTCKHCGSGKWERTGMMKEKKVDITPKLSIRGGEQKFVNSDVTDANLDLLMPDA